MMIERGSADEYPVVGAYLEFLAQQMEVQPIRGLASLDRAEALVGYIEVDLDEDLGQGEDLQL